MNSNLNSPLKVNKVKKVYPKSSPPFLFRISPKPPEYVFAKYIADNLEKQGIYRNRKKLIRSIRPDERPQTPGRGRLPGLA